LIKLTGNERTYKNMSEDMDFNAGRILSGQVTLDQASLELMELIGDTAAGEPSKPEKLGHREFFLMYKHQDSPSLEAGCRQ
jgi:altronate dehydratase large subunit